MINRLLLCLAFLISLSACSKSYKLSVLSSEVVSERPVSTIGPEEENEADKKWKKYDVLIKGDIVNYLRSSTSTFRAEITNCAENNISTDEFYVNSLSMDSIRNGGSISNENISGGTKASVYVSSEILLNNRSLCMYGRGGSMLGATVRTNEVRLK
ncbi:hypothetical protein [Asticcacaulis tiandongensis]|uniref:hypothetical protein n=1 Tax=Asticcacaulis tiandongensis TaxID=2565365 RepID=UPI0011294493|nr:hypothetical protein [Asticcacaulis tiandongensis]